MSLNSVIHSVGSVEFPTFRGTQLYMYPIDLDNITLPYGQSDFTATVETMVKKSGIPRAGEAYLTIDQKELAPNKTHRRPGPHIDGLWCKSAGKHTPPGHYMPGKWDTFPGGDWKVKGVVGGGGLILASDRVGCKAWNGVFEGEPGEGGDLSHIQKQLDSSPSFNLQAGEAYLGNVLCVHESIPVEEKTQRTLVRITLPPHIYIM